MAETFEYALMSGNAYVANRHRNNWIPRPEGWEDLSPQGGYTYDQPSGFEAVAYRKGDEIVIAFAGTDQLTDWLANFGGVAAAWVPRQLEKAAAFYAKIRQQYGENVTYSFTGHSLGGGLAALMGVLFDQKAVTFDQAPFRVSANNDVRTAIREYLAGQIGPDDQSLLLPSLATALDSFWSSQASTNPSSTPGIRGEWKVSDHSVAGEVLTSSPLVPTSQRIGGQREIIPHAGTSASAVDLHSIALLAAMKVVPGFAQAAKELPKLIPLIFDSSLYAKDPKLAETNFMELLLRRQVGIGGTPGDHMLDHFVADLNRIVTAGGMAITDADLNKALIVFALQAYHNQASGFTKELYQTVPGGLRFDRTTVVGSEGAMAGYSALQAWLGSHTDIYSPVEMGSVNGNASDDREWFIATNNMGLMAVAGSKAALMLGGAGTDQLAGGANSDILLGGSNNDILMGGQGNDILIGGTGADYLLGGAGSDTYVVTNGDILIDATDDGHGGDGQGQIDWGGLNPAGSYAQKQDSVTAWGDTDWSFEFVGERESSGLLTIVKGGERITVAGFKSGMYGIVLNAPPAAAALPPNTAAPGNMTTPYNIDNVHPFYNLRDAARMEITVAGADAEAWGNGKLVGDDNASYLHDGDDMDILDVGSGESRRWRDEMPRSGYGADAFAVYVLRLIDRHGGCRYPLGIHLKTCGHAGKRNPLTREASPGAYVPARPLGMETQVTEHNLVTKLGARGTANGAYWRAAA